MKIYRLQRIQELPVSPKKAWNFFSDPANLVIITPAFMNFNILEGTDRPMHAGQLIKYTVSPIFGFKLTWITEITQMIREEFFVDEQRFGPYSFWHHKHFFKKIEGGTLIEDIVDYKLPWGIAGQLFHNSLVAPKLKDIFDFRERKLYDLFGRFPASPISKP